MIVGSFALSFRPTRMGAGRHHEDSTTRPGQPRFHPFTPARSRSLHGADTSAGKSCPLIATPTQRVVYSNGSPS
jgi:hypothetical protein